MLSCLVACDGATKTIEPFAGTWAGGTAEFQVSLTLSQQADTVVGSLWLTRRVDSYQIQSPVVSVPLDGDFLTFSFAPPTASGYAIIEFRGQRRGDRIDAAVGLDDDELAVVLQRL